MDRHPFVRPFTQPHLTLSLQPRRSINPAAAKNPTAFLNRLDGELDSILQAQQRLSSSIEERPLIGVIQAHRQRSFVQQLYPGDWRVAVACCLLVGIFVPVAFYILEPHIMPPPPHPHTMP